MPAAGATVVVMDDDTVRLGQIWSVARRERITVCVPPRFFELRDGMTLKQLCLDYRSVCWRRGVARRRRRTLGTWAGW
jgi:hypothetical protein